MMFGKSTPSNANAADAAAPPVEHALQSTQRVADQALDKLSSTAQDTREQVSPLLVRAGEQASALAQRGVDAVRDRSLQMREQALRASGSEAESLRKAALNVSPMPSWFNGAGMLIINRARVSSAVRPVSVVRYSSISLIPPPGPREA